MSETSEAEIREYLLEQLIEQLQVAGVSPDDVDDSTDLLASGIVDSLGVLELMTVVSDRFGVEDDWEDLDPEILLVVGPFCRYAECTLGACAPTTRHHDSPGASDDRGSTQTRHSRGALAAAGDLDP